MLTHLKYWLALAGVMNCKISGRDAKAAQGSLTAMRLVWDRSEYGVKPRSAKDEGW